MASEEVTIDVAPDGSIKIEGHGFVGAECKKITAALESALGDVTRERKKAEFNQRPSFVGRGKVAGRG